MKLLSSEMGRFFRCEWLSMVQKIIYIFRHGDKYSVETSCFGLSNVCFRILCSREQLDDRDLTILDEIANDEMTILRNILSKYHSEKDELNIFNIAVISILPCQLVFSWILTTICFF